MRRSWHRIPALRLAAMVAVCWMTGSGDLRVVAVRDAVDQTLLARIPERLQQFVDRGLISGAVTLVMHHGGVLRVDAVGYQDLETNAPVSPSKGAAMYAITGATGNTGSVIAETLLEKKQKVRVIGRKAEKLQRFVQKGAEAFAGDVTDEVAMTRAFTGARAVYTMTPPDMVIADYPAYQERVSDALSAAIEKAGVTHAVNLSSIGAHRAEKVGPVVGLHNFEQKLNRIAKLNVLHLRPAYYMENLLMQIGLIQAFGLMGGPLRADLSIALIATRDIGPVVAQALLKLDFSGSRTRELLGQRDVSMAEAAAVIGKALGKPGLAYVQFPAIQVEQALTQMGVARGTAKLLNEMADALNSGYMAPLEPRSPQNTTATSIETFVAEEFLPRFQGRSAAKA